MNTIVNCTEETPIEVHPWRRYFARSLDISLMSILIFFLLMYIAPLKYIKIATLLYKIRPFDIQLLVTIAIIFNSFLMGLTGTTIGKFVFGVRVLNENNQKPSLYETINREFNVFMRGMAFSVPIASLVALMKSHSRLTLKKKTSWDERLKCTVTYRKNNMMQKVLTFIGVTLCVSLVLYSSSLGL